MYHFFVDNSQVEEEHIIIEGSDVNHIKNVLRMRDGEEITVSDGRNMEYHCRITAIENHAVTARILSRKESFAELPAKIYLFQGLPKADKLELIIQKAVELGAYAVVPVETSRAVVKLDAKKAESKRKRWNAIAESAAKQSGRTIVPEIFSLMSFKEAVQYVKDFEYKWIPYELSKEMEQTKEAIASVRPDTSIAIFIGPEGGFTQEEIAYAVQQGLLPITLGKRILRTETAGMALLSVLMFQLERKV